ncbi:Exocyst complex component 3-like protein 2 [Sciurus carolinensis]|uniref:Exocyst complex component 3-like protein 2 n=1 Tax=Sciurus carolinensis TaxID=30640 RepID=A0AA41SVF1_SCICA|nr:Exocyst complex component 3-like protein 2 [Sciurus carolinensis]
MPILKSLGVADSKVPRAGTLPLRSSRNPFEEIPGLEEEAGELGTLPNGTSCHRRATLEKLAGLSPFRLGWAPGRRAVSPGDGPSRSFLGRVLAPGLRRSSADFGLLARLQGTRAHGDEEATGEAARRLAFLRLGRGPKPRRASLAERVVPAGEAAPEPPPKAPEPPKMKEPLSVLEILSLIQQRELARADEHILELEAEELASSGGGAPGPPVAEGASGGRRARDLEALRARLLEDMAVVRGRLAPAYPAGLGAFGVYLRGYHGALAEWLGTSARRRLPLADRYALLHWHNQVYPREVLGLVDMVALENGELGPLLSLGTLRGLEDECVTDVKAQTRAALLRVLQEDEEHWADVEDWSSSLAQDVCELLEEHTERAPRISQEFGERMAHCCLGGLAEFLQSFQQRVERFHENPGIRELPSDTYISRTISLVNCGPPLRALAERLARVGPPESEPAREASASSLDRVTRLCHRVLADMLFQELQPYFDKLMRRKWLSSPEALDGIVGTLGAQALALRRMQDEPYQALVAELHRRALVEYVRPLLRGRLHCRSARTRSRMAGRLREDAAQLQRLFRRLESQASWLDAVVPHLAEVLQLEDTPSIQVEVGVLVRDYPDIRRKHVAALLDVRGLHNTATRQEILAVARDLELSEGGALSPPRDRAFFSDIPVPRPSFCLSLPLFVGRLPLSRLARPSLACLPLRPRPLSPSRPRAQR